jgi:predicted site-specific integrase-resolvase
MLLLAPRDAARRLHISTSRLVQLAREGRLVAIRDSAGRRFYEPAEVEKLAAERAKRSEPAA